MKYGYRKDLPKDAIHDNEFVEKNTPLKSSIRCQESRCILLFSELQKNMVLPVNTNLPVLSDESLKITDQTVTFPFSRVSQVKAKLVGNKVWCLFMPENGQLPQLSTNDNMRTFSPQAMMKEKLMMLKQAENDDHLSM